MVLGPFLALKAEDIENEVHEMWRTMYKLTKVLSDAAGPKIGAERFKSKIDKFKNHMPLLRTICNPGIRDRHWKQVKRWQFLVISTSKNIVSSLRSCCVFAC